jgi:hypothetical protein
LTANIPLTTWELPDELHLKNRSVWLNRVLLDEIKREQEDIDLHASRTAAIKKDVALMNDPAKFLHKVSDKRILASALGRVPKDKKRLYNDLYRLLTSMKED